MPDNSTLQGRHQTIYTLFSHGWNSYSIFFQTRFVCFANKISFVYNCEVGCGHGAPDTSHPARQVCIQRFCPNIWRIQHEHDEVGSSCWLLWSFDSFKLNLTFEGISCWSDPAVSDKITLYPPWLLVVDTRSAEHFCNLIPINMDLCT